MRTSVGAERMNAATCVRHYKSLAQVEPAFRHCRPHGWHCRPHGWHCRPHGWSMKTMELFQVTAGLPNMAKYWEGFC